MEATSELPELCFSFIGTNKPGQFIGAIKRGETGYYRTTYDETDTKKARELVDYLNTEKLSLSTAQVEAMICGSHFGWDVPGASVAKQEELLRTIAARAA